MEQKIATQGAPAASVRWLALLGVSMGVLMGTIDGSIVNIALPTLVRELKVSFATVQWVVLSYLLVITALLPSAARLGDMVGKKHVYTIGLAVFTIGSLLCGLAPNSAWLIGFRALQGLGAVLVTALGAAIITEVFPPQERGRALGVIGAVVSIGIALGPSLGGVLIGLSGWRSIFLVNIPVGIAAVFMVRRFVPEGQRGAPGQRFDFVGAALLSFSLIAFALALTLGQGWGFTDVRTLGLVGVAGVSLAAFLIVETRVAQPMIDLRMFRNGLFSLNLLIGLITFVMLAGNGLVLPFFLENVKGFSTIQTGLLLAVIPAILVIISPISGVLSDRFGPRPIIVGGLLLLTIGMLLASTLSAEVSVIGYLLRVGLIGIGFGVFQSPNNSAIMGAAPRAQLGVASGLLALSRTLGQTAGITVMGALFAGLAIAAGAADLSSASAGAIVAGVQGTYRVATILAVVTLALAGLSFVRGQRVPVAPAQPIEKPLLAE
ncbi:MAG: DHA2 family efflux MFS transporter permease subunit [Chloroflexales bacterium]|nr:DHA2 family efflux MFS transporter permease subunit [Chloroflexales bacterium]